MSLCGFRNQQTSLEGHCPPMSNTPSSHLGVPAVLGAGERLPRDLCDNEKFIQWEFQALKLEVLHQIKAIFGNKSAEI